MTHRTKSAHRRRPCVRVQLPSLTAHEALVFTTLLERLIASLWRAHGDAMAELLADDSFNRPRTHTHQLSLPIEQHDPDLDLL